MCCALILPSIHYHIRYWGDVQEFETGGAANNPSMLKWGKKGGGANLNSNSKPPDSHFVRVMDVE